jgi:hypothetical protein
MLEIGVPRAGAGSRIITLGTRGDGRVGREYPLGAARMRPAAYRATTREGLAELICPSVTWKITIILP